MMDLSNFEGNYLRINSLLWPHLLRLAFEYGWSPAGTLAPHEYVENNLEWDPMQYCTNDFQIVTAEDSRAIANALEKALEEIPDDPDSVSIKTNIEPLEINLPDISGAQLVPLGFWEMRPVGKEWLREFIKFLKEEAFMIG